jgi:hypothetical protein
MRLHMQQMEAWESSLLIAWYCLYVILVWFVKIDTGSSRLFSADEVRPLMSIEATKVAHVPPVTDVEVFTPDDEQESWCLLRYVSYPFQAFFNLTIPQISSDVSPVRSVFC